MKINSASTALVAAAFLLSGLSVQPALAHTGGGGGGGHSGGGHSFAGHDGGGGRVATQHYAGGPGYAGARSTGYSRGYSGASAGRAYASTGAVSHGAVTAAAFGGRGYYGRGGYGRGVGWAGGYWGGRFWPGVYYGAGFAWFLPVLPLYCSTYWWNNVPYYYYNDAYYTWSPTADGYVATDPPPAATSGNANAGGASPSDANNPGYNDAAAPADTAPVAGPAGGAGSDNVFAYPANGQSEAQQATDRMQCDQWAASQAGGASGSADFHRAVIACYQGRGYSAQ
jgi:hypothetical protein